MRHWLTVICVLMLATVHAQERFTFTRNIDSLIQGFLVRENFPSAAVGIVYDGKTQFAKRIFNQSVEGSLPANNRTVYNIASVAKPFVATAIMILAEEGKLDIDQPVTEYLPDFRIDSRYLENITIRHLLTHTSGLPNTSTPTDYEYNQVDTTDEALTKHIRSLSTLTLDFKPGKKHSYSNVGFEVLGEVIAEVSGHSFDGFMKERLFQPLKMNNTSYLLSDFERAEIAMPHEGDPYQRTEKFPYNRAFSPSGNLFTTVDDLNNWMIFNLNEGELEGFKPLGKQHFDELWKPQFKTDDDEAVGLSWFLKDDLVFHDGKDLGYTALMMLYTNQKVGITVLINHVDANCNELLNLVARSIRF
ncbi:MAG: serine hydrolase domain-containing protein [Bacteroidota bacterium]